MEWLKDKWNRFIAHLKGSVKSWTIWFNSAMGTAIVLLPAAQEQLPQLQGILPANLYNYAMGALVVGNIILRFKTNSALADKV